MAEVREPRILEGLPGAEIVGPGLEDLRAGRESVEALAVQMASARLRELGLDVPGGKAGPPATGQSGEPASHRLYRLLAEQHGDGAHSRYNAIARRMVSFARAAERAQTR